jgi:DNA repair exonuclease SbcCD nuclease subunit
LKVAIITDTHFGARNDSLNFDKSFRKFFEETFFPYIDEHNIKTIFHLGDVFDRRKYVNFNTLRSCKEYFFHPLLERNIDMKVIIGNHDTYYKNTNEINSLDLLLREFPNIEIIESPVVQTIDGSKCTFIPWICSDNYQECMNVLEQESKFCFGHFEISGFHMFRGAVNDHGLNRDLLKNFDMVFSGHFHHKSTQDNIYYLGSPYQFIWSDHADERGFHIFDLKTQDVTFIRNPNEMFQKVYYDDRKELPSIKHCKDSCVRVIVVHKSDYEKFDKFMDSLYNKNVHDLTIHEDFSEFENETLDESDMDLEDTMTLLTEYVDGIESNKDKERLKTLLKTLYVEAQNLEI